MALGANVTAFRTAEDIKKLFADGVTTGFDFVNEGSGMGDTELRGYVNHDGGWAESARSLEILLQRVRSLGVKVEAGKEVSGIIYRYRAAGHDPVNPLQRREIAGVRCADGSGHEASVVIVAAGAWTPRLVQRWGVGISEEQGGHEVDVKEDRHVGVGLATGCVYYRVFVGKSADLRSLSHVSQTVATIQLTSAEAKRYRSCPVVLDFGTGFYIFPVSTPGLQANPE